MPFLSIDSIAAYQRPTSNAHTSRGITKPPQSEVGVLTLPLFALRPSGGRNLARFHEVVIVTREISLGGNLQMHVN